MADDKRIRERAYALWEEQGQPHGRHHEHWDQARREIGDESQPPAQAAPAKRSVRQKDESGGDRTAAEPSKRRTRSKAAAAAAEAPAKPAKPRGRRS